MPSRRLTISVSQPCQENWDQMAPQAQGRFCQNCAKTVVDFTGMSDREVIDWLGKQKEATCGRFRKSQLDREFLLPIPSKTRFTWYSLALAGFSAWVLSKTAEAKPAFIPLSTEKTVSCNTISSLPLEADYDFVLQGKIVDSREKTPLPGVTVLLKHTTIAVPTNAEGNFSLQVSATVSIENQVVVFSFLGFHTQEHKISELLKMPHRTIELVLDARPLDEPILLGGYHPKWYSPSNLFFKVRNLFRS